MEAAPVAAVLHLHAFVHDHGEAGGARPFGGGEIHDPQLEPEGGRVDASLFPRDRLVDDLIDVARGTENVDQVDREGGPRPDRDKRFRPGSSRPWD